MNGGFFARGRLARGFLLGAMLLAMLEATAIAGPFATRCVQERKPLLDAIDYSLYVTAPSTGYRFFLVRTRMKGAVVRIAVRSRLDPGLHAQVLQTRRVRFTVIAPNFPTRYAVAFNGRRASRPGLIVIPKFAP